MMLPSKSTEQRILEMIQASPGIETHEIISRLRGLFGIPVSKNLLLPLLHGSLKKHLRQDQDSRWYPASHASKATSNRSSQQPPSSLARLAHYYLECLSADNDQGISVFAEDRYGKPDYAPLSLLPLVTEKQDEAFSTADYRHLLHKLRKDNSSLTLHLGYPIRLRHIQSKDSHEKRFKLEPLFLFPIELTADGQSLSLEPGSIPLFNVAAWKGFAIGGDSHLREEIAALSTELGFDQPPARQPEWHEVCHRLAELTAAWDWKEPLDPHHLAITPLLTELHEEGIYNRAALLIGETSMYTRGLEGELSKLMEQHALSGDSVLQNLLDGSVEQKPIDEERPLLEMLPLNHEQREVVRKALTQPLTVVTGPPGTGKSQVVSAILANAAWHGMNVLFASKNNKAVDVVENRLNGLAERPIVLRLGGATESQARLADYLTHLLASIPSAEEELSYDTHMAHMKSIQARLSEHQHRQQRRMEQQNKVDKLDQMTAHDRKKLPEPLFESFRQNDELSKLREILVHASILLKRATKEEQGFFSRIAWPLLRDGRMRHVTKAVNEWILLGERLNIKPPSHHVDSMIETLLPAWKEFLTQCGKRHQQYENIANYFMALEELKTFPPLAQIHRDISEQQEKLVQASGALWKSWVRLQPKRLSTDERRVLNDYIALLRMMAKPDDTNGQNPKGIWRKYYSLLPQVARCLPCWAVTSLSAKGRIPFEEGFFDLVVMDEASQCDIASALPLIYRAKRLVIIGDPKQLRHITTLNRLQDIHLLEKHQLENDFLGWSYGNHSLFDLAQASNATAEQMVMLRDHHRSHAHIIEFSNRQFYGGALRVATQQEQLKLPARFQQAICWTDVQGNAIRPSQGSALNLQEVQYVIRELRQLLVENLYEGSVGVVSPFRAQANAIRQALHEDAQLSLLVDKHHILVDTAHKFQGDERDVIIFSPVISENTPRGTLNFLRNNSNLFNVAITRARALLLVVGDRQAIAHCGIPYLQDFASYVHGLAGEPQKGDIIANISVSKDDSHRRFISK